MTFTPRERISIAHAGLSGRTLSMKRRTTTTPMGERACQPAPGAPPGLWVLRLLPDHRLQDPVRAARVLSSRRRGRIQTCAGFGCVVGDSQSIRPAASMCCFTPHGGLDARCPVTPHPPRIGASRSKASSQELGRASVAQPQITFAGRTERGGRAPARRLFSPESPTRLARCR